MGDNGVPHGWAVRQLQEVATVLLSSVDKKAKEGEPQVRLCNYMDVYTNPTIHRGLDFMRATAKPAHIQRLGLRRGDVIITKDSEDPSDIGVPAVVVTDFRESVVCGYHMALLRPHDNINGEFLAWVIRGHRVKNQFERRAHGTTRFGLTSKVIRRTEALFPPLPEQERIAATLASVDDAIAATRKIIEQTKRVKMGLLQTLMTCGIGHTRFKQTEIGEIPEEWEVSTVGTEFDTQLGKMLNKKARTGPNQLPYLGNAQVQWDRVDLSGIATMHFDEGEMEKFSLRDGDLLVCEGGEIGRSAIWRAEVPECYYQKAIHRLRSKTGYSPLFLLRYMRLAAESGRFSAFSGRTSISHLTQEKLRRLPIPVPSRSEQEEIDEILDSLDRDLTHQKESEEQLNLLKRGLLQDLLTGRVRVQPD